MAKVAKKQAKFGRNKDYCTVYARENKREKNKIRKLTKLLVTHPNDKCIPAAIEAARRVIKGY